METFRSKDNRNIKERQMTPLKPPPPQPKRPAAPAPSTSPTSAAVKIGVRQPKAIVPRIILHATEKFGKTSLASFAPDPAIAMVRDTGYDTLLGAGTVPAIPGSEVNGWLELLAFVRSVSESKEYRTIIIDGLTGAERACQEYVCDTMFNGDWGDSGFLSYHKGYVHAATEWLKLLSALDRCQAAGITVIILAHSRTKEVKNPMGATYDRFEPECHEKTWGACAKWADAILFGKFHTIVEKGKREASKNLAEQKGKAIGGTQRVIFTENHDAFVAGNRYGMESEIWIEGGPETMYQQVMDQIRKP